MPIPGVNVFFDSNVVLYLLSGDAAKADRAETLLADGGVVSVQVLNEIANVARRKLGMTWVEVGEILTQVRTVCRVEALTVETHLRGIEVAERHGFSVYDAMIIASALEAGCQTLYTEDLQDGQKIEDILTVRNPFR
ncbi:MAG: PIN domain-containing protein [Gammaproteobacteria bacterium]|nr:PIN domain-containing protein [Gammaproteobacteria bacterium]